MLSDNFFENRGEALRHHNINTDEIELHYILFRQTDPTMERECFSVSIDCIFESEHDSSFAYDISSLPEDANEIFDKLCAYLVTPCTLFDVLENIL